MKKYLGSIYIFISAVFWGTSGLFVNSLRNIFGIKDIQIILGRSIFTVLFLGLFMLFFARDALKIKLKDLWIFACAGVLSIAFFNFCYYRTMAYMGISVAAVLMYTAPIFVMIISVIFFKEKVTFVKVACCLLAVLGCALVSGIIGSTASFNGIGLVFGLLTGFGYSLYGIISSILLKKGYNSFTINFYSFIFVAISCVIFDIQNLKHTYSLYTASYKPMVIILLMALINTVIPYILYSSGLKTVKPTVGIIIATVEPVVATILDMAVYRKFPDIFGYLGIIIILTSVLVLNLFGEKEKNHVS